MSEVLKQNQYFYYPIQHIDSELAYWRIRLYTKLKSSDFILFESPRDKKISSRDIVEIDSMRPQTDFQKRGFVNRTMAKTRKKKMFPMKVKGWDDGVAKEQAKELIDHLLVLEKWKHLQDSDDDDYLDAFYKRVRTYLTEEIHIKQRNKALTQGIKEARDIHKGRQFVFAGSTHFSTLDKKDWKKLKVTPVPICFPSGEVEYKRK